MHRKACVKPFENHLKRISESPADVRLGLLGSRRNDHPNPTPHPVEAAPSTPAAPFSETICEARGVLFRAEKPATHSAMKFSPPALSIQVKRRNPSPHQDLFIKIAAGAIITLTSPIWFPPWILLLPFKRRRERRKRERIIHRAPVLLIL